MAEPYPKAGSFLKSSCCVSVTLRISAAGIHYSSVLHLPLGGDQTSEDFMGLHYVLIELRVTKFEGDNV